MVTTANISSALERIAPYIVKTPVEKSREFLDALNLNVYFKLENLQASGSFKPRGGINKILKSLESNPASTFVAPTAGGHGVGLAYSGYILDANVHVMMPKSADRDRVKHIQQYGAQISFFDSIAEARDAALIMSEKENAVFVSAYNDIEMIEGGGTIALELSTQMPQIDCLVCGVGGGGYISGMATVLKSKNPTMKIIGVQQEFAPMLHNWFKSGVYEVTSERPSIAEGIGAMVEESSITLPIMKKYVDDFFLVSEEDISSTVSWFMDCHKHYVEPSAVVGVSAIRKYADYFRQFNNIATVITGRNVSLERLKKIIL